MKEEALNIDKEKNVGDKTAAEDTKKKTGVDVTKDKTTNDSSEPKEDAAKEEFKAEATDRAKESQAAEEEESKAQAPPRLSIKERLNAKLSSVNDKYAGKYPNAHKKTTHYFHTLKEVWQETFPDAEQKAHDKISARRERAKMAREWEEKQKDMT